MTKEEIKVRTSVQQAYLDGKTIQVRRSSVEDWVDCDNPSFNWETFEYRAKPEPWRALFTEVYYYIASDGTIATGCDSRKLEDNLRYNFHNYFRSQIDAENAMKKVKEFLIEINPNLY